MYAAFFGLRHEPFSIAPDPRYLFMSERHREALAHLLYGLSGGGGFVLLTGEIGAGKTTVCRCFLEQVPAHCHIAYIFNPRLTVEELLRTVCEEYGIALPAAESGPLSLKAVVDRLNAFLLQAHAAGRSCVLIIDEAQQLSAEVLEQLRLLTNLETSERKLLQIILIGQPELRGMLAQPELEQLAQRVIARYHLGALQPEETAQYVRHRLAVAGAAAAALPFDARALGLIHRLSRGVPRRINLLCDRALLGAYAQGRAKVDARTVRRAAAEVFEGPAPAPAGSRRAWLLGGGLGLGLVALATAAALGLGPRLPWGTPEPEPVAAPQAASAPASQVAAAPEAASAASAAAQPVEPSELAEVPPAELGPQAERQAWAALARLWALPKAEALAAQDDPCQALKARADAAPETEPGLRCFRSEEGLAQLRLLDRPALLRLQPPERGAAPVYALLVGLDGRQARLRLPDGRVQRLDLLSLARLWRGEFLTLWRSPPGGYQGRILSDTGLGWLDLQLARVFDQPPLAQTAGDSRARYDAALQARVAAFQRSQGLRSDGRAGPITLMQLNRAAGLDEPRLERPPA